MKSIKLFPIVIALAVSGLGQAGGAGRAANTGTAAPAGSAVICHKLTRTQVAGLFERWNNSLKTLDPRKVTANYLSDGLLLPTVSNRPRRNHAEINDYFVEFLKKRPVGTINERHVRIGCNMAIDGGIYTFKFNDGEEITGRYTYVYEYQNGQWLIASHHSSALPKDVKLEPWVDDK